MRKYFQTVASETTGKPVYQAQIRVFANRTTTPVTVYSDNGITMLSQPVLTDGTGYFEFYVADGKYRLQVADPDGTNPRNFDDVEMFEDARNVSVPVGEAAVTIPSSAARAGKVLTFDVSGNPSATAKEDIGGTGPAGPSNVLTAGTVTKIAAGGTPTISITGTSPAQVLNVGLVTGDKGDAGGVGPAGYTSTDTWAHLNAITPSGGAGSTGFAIGPDTGTHTDANGATLVPNTGQFTYQASPAGWIRIGAALSPQFDISYVPNGTAARFVTLVTAAGSSVGSTEQTALLDVEHRLRSAGILAKIVRLDLFVGAAAAAARIPFVQRLGCGNSSATGTISSWTQASGLTGVTLDTGVTISQAGLGGYNIGLGCYSLADATSEAGIVVGGSGWGLDPFAGSTASATAGFYTFDFNGRILGDISTIFAAGTALYRSGGSMHGLRLASGSGIILRNGVQLTGNGTTTAPDATSTIPTDTIKYGTTVAAIGAAWITDGMTAPEAAMLHWIVHQFNIAIGRSAVGEGI